MATDLTPPRNGLILGIAVASVFTLGSLKLIFDSYYRYMMEAEVAAKAAAPVELLAARVADEKRLAAGPMPIDKAMQSVAKSRGEIISPQQSTDDAPLVGWSKTPRTVPAMLAAADAGAAVAEAGVGEPAAATADGGTKVLAGDAGPKSATPPVPVPVPGAPAPGAPKSPAPAPKGH